LKAVDVIAGIKAVGTDLRLIQGTGEFFQVMRTEKSKRGIVKDASRNGLGDTEEVVVARKVL